MSRDLPPIHPSEILKEDFMNPFNISLNKLASDIQVSFKTLEDFLNEKQPLTANLALRFARYFGTDAQSWLNLQTHYDLEIMQEILNDDLKNKIKPFQHIPAQSLK